jgi:metal-responsive CopG/Arc/MetJ family transcriptional regulator
VASKGYKAVNLPDDLVEELDEFLAKNKQGYRSRAEVNATALRVFIANEGKMPSREEIRAIVRDELAQQER